jgi:hypothetical protein
MTETNNKTSQELKFPIYKLNLGVAAGLVFAGLSLTGCQDCHKQVASNEGHYDFTSAYATCIPGDASDKTLAEHQHDCAYEHYKDKKEELENLYTEVAALYQDQAKRYPTEMHKAQLDKLMSSQEHFLKFVKWNAKMSNAAYTNNYPYHYYGSMTDYINLRIKHLNNLREELGR